MSNYKVNHVAGPTVNLLQTCSRCGAILWAPVGMMRLVAPSVEGRIVTTTPPGVDFNAVAVDCLDTVPERSSSARSDSRNLRSHARVALQSLAPYYFKLEQSELLAEHAFTIARAMVAEEKRAASNTDEL